MANNRLWAVCRDDGEATSVCKWYGWFEGWGEISDRQKEFFERHAGCPSNRGCGENFVFVTEMEERIKKIDMTSYPKDGIVRIEFADGTVIPTPNA